MSLSAFKYSVAISSLFVAASLIFSSLDADSDRRGYYAFGAEPFILACLKILASAHEYWIIGEHSALTPLSGLSLPLQLLRSLFLEVLVLQGGCYLFLKAISILVADRSLTLILQ